jgi:hypothetical protein
LFWLTVPQILGHVLAWPHHCGPIVRQRIMAEGAVEHSCLPHDSWETKKGRSLGQDTAPKNMPQLPTSSNKIPIQKVSTTSQ